VNEAGCKARAVARSCQQDMDACVSGAEHFSDTVLSNYIQPEAIACSCRSGFVAVFGRSNEQADSKSCAVVIAACASPALQVVIRLPVVDSESVLQHMEWSPPALDDILLLLFSNHIAVLSTTRAGRCALRCMTACTSACLRHDCATCIAPRLAHLIATRSMALLEYTRGVSC
jgi:hypothetical protein